MIVVAGKGGAIGRSGNRALPKLADIAARIASMRANGTVAKWCGRLASAIVLGLVLYAVRRTEWATLGLARSAGMLFWVTLIASYFHAPLADLAIFGPLWSKPKGLFVTLCRKQIVNAAALPYAGEALVVAWAHQREIRGFDATKDAAILSGIVGSIFTITMVIPVWGTLSAALDIAPSSLIASLGLLSAVPLVALLGRSDIFTLTGAELCRIGTIHAARTLANIVLMALCWHLLLPAEPLQCWVMLGAARMVVSRLPLLPGKELALAAIAGTMFPQSPEVGATVMVTGLLLTLGHLILWFALVIRDHGRVSSIAATI